MSYRLFIAISILIFAVVTFADDRTDLLRAKQASREAIIAAQAPSIKPQALAFETLEDLIDSKDLTKTDGRLIRTLGEIEDLGWREFHLLNDIWSGYTWLEYTGHTALRYSVAENFVEARDAYANNEIAIDDLSPAEKFDRMIADPRLYPKGIFAKYEWHEGAETYRRYNFVPKWTGYCHGWAAAAIRVPRPKKAIDVLSFDGKTKIRFYPQDLKALVTALWANGLPPTRLIGSRCKVSSPQRLRNGRIRNPDCFSVNPATFHLALVNQVAGAEKNLVIDSYYDVEVWNYPIFAYSYRYFNPKTGESVATLAEATVDRAQFKNDPYKKWRSSKTKSIVGIVTDVDYVIANEPKKQFIDTPSDDVTYHNVYAYDLELDANGNVIGGEWHQEHHPDFLWVLAGTNMAKTMYEGEATGDWKLTRPLPESWRKAAFKAAGDGRPLARIVEKMIQAAQ